MIPTLHHSAATARIRGAAIGALITLIFGVLWALWGDLALGGLLGLLLTVGTVAFAAALIAAAVRLLLVTQRMRSGTPINPFKAFSYRLALIFEAIAIPVVDGDLSKTHHAVYVAPVTAIIVGIHFFGLVPAFKTRLYLVIGGAMCALASLTMFLLPATETVGGAVSPHQFLIWTVVVSLGCAAILWLSAITRLMHAYQWVRQAPMK